MAVQPLHEFGPAKPGDDPAALGFALALAAQWAGAAGMVWAGEQGVFTETGAPYPPGLAAFGIDLARLIVVPAKKREDALWAAEQGLSLPGAVVICALATRGRALDLKVTRRLLLFAERHRSRCLLLRPESGPSAAWTRWRIAAAPGQAPARELGAHAFRAELVRNRAGPAGRSYILDWNADARCFTEREETLARDISAAPEDRSADPLRARA